MALTKDDLNNALKKEQKTSVTAVQKKQYKWITTEGVDEDGFKYTITQRVEVKPGESLSSVTGRVQKQQEESFAKKATKVGNKDGEVVGGVKSLGKETISPKEVTETSVGQITDKVGSLTGTKTPSASLGSLTGLPAQVAGDKAKSGVVGIGSGSPTGIASTVAAGKDRTGDLATDVSAFSTTIADAGELSNIQSSLPNVDFGDLTGTIKKVSPISSITGKLDDVVDNVVNDTGIGGFAPKSPKSENGLSFFKDAKSLVASSLTDVTSSLNNLTNAIDSKVSQVTSKFSEGLQGGFLQNIGESITGFAKGTIANIVPGGLSLSDNEYEEMFAELTSDDTTKKTSAVKTLTNKSPNVSPTMKGIINNTKATNTNELKTKVITEAEKQGVPQSEIDAATNEISVIEEAASKLDTTIGGTLVIDDKFFADDISISDNNQKWSGRTSSNDVFTYVSSVEELDTEFAKISREVTEVVIHATETFTNKNIGAIEINNIHNELGHDGIGYHYVIRRDGRIQRGRPVNRKGEHAPVNGHDEYSIGIVMVGGLDGPSETPVVRSSAGSFTRAQYTALEQFIGAFYRQYPGGQVFGHSDIDENEVDPYFDVVDYIESVFRKKNKTLEPSDKGPLTPVEIIKGVSFITKSQRLEEKEDVAFELENTDDVVIEDIDEERQTNIFVRPPKPEGYPQTRVDGVVIDYEWDEGGNEWIQSEDWTDYKEGNIDSPSTTQVYGVADFDEDFE